MLPFELLYRNITSEEVPSENLSNLSGDEDKALRNSTKQKDIIIQNADKGNTVVILDNETNIEKMKVLLSDIKKLKIVWKKITTFFKRRVSIIL